MINEPPGGQVPNNNLPVGPTFVLPNSYYPASIGLNNIIDRYYSQPDLLIKIMDPKWKYEDILAEYDQDTDLNIPVTIEDVIQWKANFRSAFNQPSDMFTYTNIPAVDLIALMHGGPTQPFGLFFHFGYAPVNPSSSGNPYRLIVVGYDQNYSILWSQIIAERTDP